jgi:hypothetical protein
VLLIKYSFSSEALPAFHLHYPAPSQLKLNVLLKCVCVGVRLGWAVTIKYCDRIDDIGNGSSNFDYFLSDIAK